MAMSASILLRQSQSLVMTPQLMQSIQLLQMTHFELIQFISQEVEKNPLLEFDANDASNGSEASAILDSIDNASVDAVIVNASEREDWYQDNSATLGDHLDTTYENVYDDEVYASGASPELPGQWYDAANGTGEAYDLNDFVAAQLSLREHLVQQIPLFVGNQQHQIIAFQLLDHLEETGYLEHGGVDQVAERLAITSSEVNEVLARLQLLDPPGVFARDLKECLSIQLKQKDAFSEPMRVMLDHLDLLAKRDFAGLKKLCGCDETDILDMLGSIRSLNPRPSAGYEYDIVETAVPDVFVKKDAEGNWTVELNPATLPKVLVNETYFSKVSNGLVGNAKDKSFLSDCLQTAHWLTRSLDQRAKTMIKVSREIIRQQKAFFDHGIDHLKPLNLKTVAEAIQMHESTVSRVTSKKYMMTPRGLFELKYFFNASLGGVDGGDIHSAESVRQRIARMIAQESADSVLSDDDLVTLLRESGIDIARRTVAKYREALGIGSSVQRRREKKLLR